MSTMEDTFKRLKREGRKAFIPFMPVGYPNLNACGDLLETLEKNGADVIELGAPFSDSLADGPVIQQAYWESLSHGLTMAKLFDFVKEQRKARKVPFVLMCCYNLIHKHGAGEFTDHCLKSGIDGVIVPDLPIEESSALRKQLTAAGLRFVDLVAPTTPPARAHRIAKASSGFLYYIARRGVTGVQEELDADLKLVVRDLKKHAKVPVMVGFGISTPAQAKVVARVADGVIVGSALVNTVRQNKRKNYLEAVGELTRGFRSALG